MPCGLPAFFSDARVHVHACYACARICCCCSLCRCCLSKGVSGWGKRHTHACLCELTVCGSSTERAECWPHTTRNTHGGAAPNAAGLPWGPLLFAVDVAVSSLVSSGQTRTVGCRERHKEPKGEGAAQCLSMRGARHGALVGLPSSSSSQHTAYTHTHAHTTGLPTPRRKPQRLAVVPARTLVTTTSNTRHSLVNVPIIALATRHSSFPLLCHTHGKRPPSLGGDATRACHSGSRGGRACLPPPPPAFTLPCTPSKRLPGRDSTSLHRIRHHVEQPARPAARARYDGPERLCCLSPAHAGRPVLQPLSRHGGGHAAAATASEHGVCPLSLCARLCIVVVVVVHGVHVAATAAASAHGRPSTAAAAWVARSGCQLEWRVRRLHVRL